MSKDGTILNIAYSALKDTQCPPNTVELYKKACTLGFNALKGDVRPTLDGNLVMCHDGGFTLNEQGRIVGYDSNNCVLISEMTTEEVQALEYEDWHEELGYYAHPATFEQFVQVCKENGEICHPTLRDGNVEVVIKKTLEVLKKYGMESQTIVNSMIGQLQKNLRDFTLCTQSSSKGGIIWN